LNFLDSNAANALHEKLSVASGDTMLNIEQQLLGTHHGELGARLALHWGLPEEIIAVIRYHHMPENADAEVGQPLVNLVHLAEKILPNLGIPEHTGPEILPQEWINLGIEATESNDIIQEVKTVAEQAKQLAIV
jgi:HD-like signal output (HDOD) protein